MGLNFNPANAAHHPSEPLLQRLLRHGRAFSDLEEVNREGAETARAKINVCGIAPFPQALACTRIPLGPCSSADSGPVGLQWHLRRIRSQVIPTLLFPGLHFE